MVTRQELLALAANTENLIARTTEPDAFQLEQRDPMTVRMGAVAVFRCGQFRHAELVDAERFDGVDHVRGTVHRGPFPLAADGV